MVTLRPKTIAGIAAVAATLKDFSLSRYWDKPDEDRDWDVMLITWFLDGLIEVGQAGEAGGVLAQNEEAVHERIRGKGP
jgi:hypothetical protein